MGLVDDHPHRWPVPLQALEHRSFRVLWLATFVSNVGSWMQRVASAWLIYKMSGSETWLGIDAAMVGLPTLLLLPFSGVLADRVDRRKLLLVANVGNALMAIFLAVLWWTGKLEIWHLLANSFVSGAIASIAAPASQSVIPTAAAGLGASFIPGGKLGVKASANAISKLDEIADATGAIAKSAPIRGAGAFADEAARIIANAATSRGLTPGSRIVNMAISRKDALIRMSSRVNGIETHLGKLAKEPGSQAANHWRGEIQNWIRETENMLPHVGKKTALEWTERSANWRSLLNSIE